jgi:hypothetical protein
MGNWWFEWLRFSSPRMNYLFMAAVFLIPIILIFIVRRVPSPKISNIGTLIMLPFALSSTLLLAGWIFLMIVWIPGVWLKDVDFSFEKIRQDIINNEKYAIYRTNGGAMTSFGIAVRREKKVLPGLLQVKRICECYPADDVQLLKKNTESLDCIFPPYGTSRPDITIVSVDI